MGSVEDRWRPGRLAVWMCSGSSSSPASSRRKPETEGRGRVGEGSEGSRPGFSEWLVKPRLLRDLFGLDSVD